MSKEVLQEILDILSGKKLYEIEDHDFFGRERELDFLDSLYKKRLPRGSHVGVYGMRRAGKTLLIHHFIHEKLKEAKSSGRPLFHILFLGSLEFSEKENYDNAYFSLRQRLKIFCQEHQINHINEWFVERLEDRKLEFKKSDFKLSNKWIYFFEDLKYVVEKLKETLPRINFIFFFDEIAWMSKKDRFLAAYSLYLNQSQVDLTGVLNFLACSSNGWIRSKIFENGKGFYSRFLKIKVEPFSFKEVVRFFDEREYKATKSEILNYYLIFGGFLKYYNEMGIDFNKTFEDNFLKLVKNKNFIQEEFHSFFAGVFGDKKPYKEIIFTLIKNRACTMLELKNKILNDFDIEIKENYLNKLLKDLISNDFVKKTRFLSENKFYCSQAILYFLHFFKESEVKNQFNWRGEMFELLCLESLPLILKEKFDITWDYKLLHKDVVPNGTDKVLAQYDIVAEKKIKSWNKNRMRHFKIFEMKFQNGPVSEEQRDHLNKKSKAFEVCMNKKGKAKVEWYFITAHSGTYERSLAELLMNID